MAGVTLKAPQSRTDSVWDDFHGHSVSDPYRWLEDQSSSETRAWLAAQTVYARSYLDAVDGRDGIRRRVRELLDTTSYDSILPTGKGVVFRKRIRKQEQHCIFLRETLYGDDQLLIDPGERGSGPLTSVRPLAMSPDGRFLFYEVKAGGLREAQFEIFDLVSHTILTDALPCGVLRGFAFGAESRSFYYVHETGSGVSSRGLTAYRHLLGTSFRDDTAVFSIDQGDKRQLRLIPGQAAVGFLTYRIGETVETDFYYWDCSAHSEPELWVQNASYRFVPRIGTTSVLALTNLHAPSGRIVEVRKGAGEGVSEFLDLIPTRQDSIRNWAVSNNQIFVEYCQGTKTRIELFSSSGKKLASVDADQNQTVRLLAATAHTETFFFECESFTSPPRIYCYSTPSGRKTLWAERKVPFASESYRRIEVSFKTLDGTSIPMSLVGREDVLMDGPHPTILTAYGGFGVPQTPQFSIFVAFLLERGCCFALPNIRGGSEFGAVWHDAARQQKRQTAINDFLSAADWLISTGRTGPGRLAIFGGSNAGLLVGAALTQRPELFRAVLCIAPLTDMLRYQHFDDARLWIDELGVSTNREDFAALLRYSPYHRVRDGVAYPATLIVSGDADQVCNPLHARKMTARLQAATNGPSPILLNYSEHRGHSPVLPLSHRIEALSDRLSFLCDQLGLAV